eukprot:TRINITY_DN12936_c0_g3_i1.p1 TRINITY_DN12936_c0_g3~~TRINITY_DN12936_c0_g3_i1.p1  ORF type:complete len:1310 (-),score=261.89 TRINITY_DN12936_c0_g3_i1:681-4541(-)
MAGPWQSEPVVSLSGPGLAGLTPQHNQQGVASPRRANDCPHCGNVYMPDSKFCRQCGKRRVEAYGPQAACSSIAAWGEPAAKHWQCASPGPAYTHEMSAGQFGLDAQYRQSSPMSRTASRRQVAVPVQVVASSCADISGRTSPQKEHTSFGNSFAVADTSAILRYPAPNAATVMPVNLLSRIEGVVAEIEKGVQEDQKHGRTTYGSGVASERQASISVDVLGERLRALEKQREAAELRSHHLADLRRVVTEGIAVPVPPSQQTFSISEESSAFRRKGRHAKDDGDVSVGGSHNISTVLSDDEDYDQMQAMDLLTQFEDKFSEELEAMGDNGARLKLHERLRMLMQAMLQRERTAEERLAEQEAVARQQQLAAEASEEARANAEEDLRVLEERSLIVLDDCRTLQARVKELEHPGSSTHHKRISELQTTLEEKSAALEDHQRHRQHQERDLELMRKHIEDQSNLLELAKAKEAAFHDETAQLQGSLKQAVADNERLRASEREHHEVLASHNRLQQQMEGMQSELAENQERERQHVHRHTELRGTAELQTKSLDQARQRIAELEDEINEARSERDHHHRHHSQVHGRLQTIEQDFEQHRSTFVQMEAENADLRERIAGLEQELRDTQEAEQRLSKSAVAASHSSDEQIACLEKMLEEEQEARSEVERLYAEANVDQKVENLQAELQEAHETMERLREELRKATDWGYRVKSDAEDALRKHDEARRVFEALAEDKERRLREQLSALQAGREEQVNNSNSPATSQLHSGHGSIRPGSAFREKCADLQRRASDSVDEAAELCNRMIELELKQVAEGLQRGSTPRSSLAAEFAGKAEASFSRRHSASLISAVEHDLLAALEEAQVHHELSEPDLQDISSSVKTLVRRFQEARQLLALDSALSHVPEDLLEGLASSLGLLSAEPRSLAAQPWLKRQTPLHWAAGHGRRDLVDFLMRQNGGDALLLAKDDSGRTPKQLAEAQGDTLLVEFFCNLNRYSSASEQLSETVPVSRHEGLPAKYQAVLAQVEQQGWASVAWRDGYTMLHWAASKGEAELAEHLLTLKADPDAQDKFGRTALDYAQEAGHSKAATLLRPVTSTTARPISPQRRQSTHFGFNTRGKSHMEARHSSVGVGEPILTKAARGRSQTDEPSKGRLRSEGVHVGVTKLPDLYLPVLEEIDQKGWQNMSWAHGFTLLHWAAKNDALDLVERFLAQGADPLQADDAGRTALDYARESASQRVMAALLKNASTPAQSDLRVSDPLPLRKQSFQPEGRASSPSKLTAIRGMAAKISSKE